MRSDRLLNIAGQDIRKLMLMQCIADGFVRADEVKLFEFHPPVSVITNGLSVESTLQGR